MADPAPLPSAARPKFHITPNSPAVSVPDDAAVHRIWDTSMTACVLVVLYDPVDVEQRVAAVRRADGSRADHWRVREYLRTDRLDALCETDPACPLPEIVQDLLVPTTEFTACAFGTQRLLAGCVPVATLVAAGTTLSLYSEDERMGCRIHHVNDASLVSLPDGRLVCVPGAYDGCHVPTYHGTSPASVLVYGRLRSESGSTHRPAHAKYLAERAALVRGLAARPEPPWRVLAGSSAMWPYGGIRNLLRNHARLLSARRRASAVLARAWCRYEGAPHGPRGRYLRDLEHGWTPAAADGVPDRCFAATAALFVDPNAYRAYAVERAAALRPRLREEHDPAVRVRLRLAALHELTSPRPPTVAV